MSSVNLDALGRKFVTDKNSDGHNYLTFYEEFFAPYRERAFTLIEVGVFAYASIKTWLEYFPKAKIIGIDIYPKHFEHARVKIFQADASDTFQMHSILQDMPPCIFIDDGSHQYSHQIATFECVFPFLQPGGLYICEDIQTSFGAFRKAYFNDQELDAATYFSTLSLLTVNDGARGDHPHLSSVSTTQRLYANYIEYMIFRRHCCLIRKKHTVTPALPKEDPAAAVTSAESLASAYQKFDSATAELSRRLTIASQTRDTLFAAWRTEQARQGDADAMVDIGYCYEHGQGVPQSYEEAFAWYAKAAEQGNPLAAYNLGHFHAHGWGGAAQDCVQAVRWFRTAAEQGNANAQYNMALRYARGEGVAQDFGQAAAWWRKAAEQGLVEAQLALGALYEAGQGVARDAAQAAFWYGEAANHGDATARQQLAKLEQMQAKKV